MGAISNGKVGHILCGLTQRLVRLKSFAVIREFRIYWQERFAVACQYRKSDDNAMTV